MKIQKGPRLKIEHNKTLFYIIIILLILFVILIIYIANQDYSEESDDVGVGGRVGIGREADLNECSLDSDCIPEICCHASTCVSAKQAPDCSNILCTMECAPGTLDCGQGECKCIEGKCAGVFVEG